MGQLQNIKKRAIRLSRLAHSIDPFDIASYLDITIIYEKLIGIHGYYTKRINTKQIHINEDLPSALQTFTCAHELWACSLTSELKHSVPPAEYIIFY